MKEVALQDANSDDGSLREETPMPIAASAVMADSPVVTQPGLGRTTTTVTTITQTGGDWSTGLFNVCGESSTCKRKRNFLNMNITMEVTTEACDSN